MTFNLFTKETRWNMKAVKVKLYKKCVIRIYNSSKDLSETNESHNLFQICQIKSFPEQKMTDLFPLFSVPH